MLIEVLKKLRKIKKSIIYKCGGILCILFLLDILGIYIYIFELSFSRYFQYPMYGDVYSYVFTKIYGSTNATLHNNLPEPINQFNYRYRIKCKCDYYNATQKNMPTIVIIVKTALNNFIKRETIRRTWGYEKRFSDINIKRVFLMGSSLNALIMKEIDDEAQIYNDILQGDFIDNYYNNTFKAMMGLDWVVRDCFQGDYYLFADDDYYISIKNVMRFVAQPSGYPKNAISLTQRWQSIKTAQTKSALYLYAGFVFQSRPIRQKFSKWYINLKEYPYNQWPPYVTAGAYILSRDTLLMLYYTSLYTKWLRFDDVYLGIVAMKCYMNLTHCDQFHVTRPQYNGPSSYRYVIASHGFDNPKEMQQIWNECRLAGFA